MDTTREDSMYLSEHMSEAWCSELIEKKKNHSFYVYLDDIGYYVSPKSSYLKDYKYKINLKWKTR